MRKTLGVSLTAVTLLFGGAGVAQATADPMPASTATTLAADTEDGDSDNTGLWGLTGLLGLLGLIGLKRRNDTQDLGRATNRGTAGVYPNQP